MNKKSYISPFTGGKAMKRIIAAAVTTLLLCSGSAAHAQTAAAPPAAAPQSATGSSTPAAPTIDASKLAPNQRQYLVFAIMGQNSMLVPEQMAKFKEMYGKMQPSQQIQMATGALQQIEQFPQQTKDQILNNMPPPK
jgi:hypothetical protein